MYVETFYCIATVWVCASESVTQSQYPFSNTEEYLRTALFLFFERVVEWWLAFFFLDFNVVVASML